MGLVGGGRNLGEAIDEHVFKIELIIQIFASTDCVD